MHPTQHRLIWTAALVAAAACVGCEQPSPTKPTCTAIIVNAGVPRAIGADASTLSLEVAAPVACEWTASKSGEFLSIVSGTSGRGPGTIQLQAPANQGAERQGFVTVGSSTVGVIQAGAPSCSFAVSPTTVSAPYNANEVPITITQTGGSTCSWSASSGNSWLQVSGAASGVGSGSTRVSIAENTGSVRTGGVSVAGSQISVEQGPATCSLVVDLPYYEIPLGGGIAEARLTQIGGHCTWFPVIIGAPGGGFLTILDPGVRTGTGTFRVSATANAGGYRSQGIDISVVESGAGQIQVHVDQPELPGACAFEASTSAIQFPVGGGPSYLTLRMTAGTLALCNINRHIVESPSFASITSIFVADAFTENIAFQAPHNLGPERINHFEMLRAAARGTYQRVIVPMTQGAGPESGQRDRFFLPTNFRAR
jgi:hypothetical protein